jgi:type I restriction enzyme S subunit
MKAYPKYIDSEIDWVGELPGHWSLKKSNYLFEIKKRIAGKLGFKILSITQNGIKIKDVDTKEGQISSDYSKYQLVEEGDFAMNHMDLLTGYVDISKYYGVTSPDYRVFSLVSSSDNSKYYLYILQVCYFRRIFYAFGRGASKFGRWRLPATEFKSFYFPNPPLEEQTAIANFLDQKTEQIDRSIEKHRELIELLKEHRAAIINEAVTKGVNPDAPMKDSGIEWIGEIPEHWEVKKLKNLALVQPSNIDKKSKDDEKEVLLCNYVDVYKNEFITDDISFMKATAADSQIEKFTLSKGDVLLTKDSEDPNDIAIPALVLHDFPNVVCGYHLTMVRPLNEIDGEFLFRVFQADSVNTHFRVSARGITRYGLSVSAFTNLPVVYPDLIEQKQIIEYIKTETTRIDKEIEATKKEIELLEEYRQSLIAEAVTGKVDVRDYQFN